MGSKVLKEAKGLGVKGGTIFLGRGAAKSHILDLLGLNEIKKEIVLMIAETGLEGKIHKGLTEKFRLDKPNHGIAFSLSVSKLLGTRDCTCSDEKISRGELDMEHEAIFTIVDRGLAEDVVESAVSAGAEGGTIIHARGSGIHEHSTLFTLSLEPEKEIVMILIEKTKSTKVIEAIKETMHIDEPGKGVMFTVDVNMVSGLFKKE
jgi:nitrogen regulatory protein PII